MNQWADMIFITAKALQSFVGQGFNDFQSMLKHQSCITAVLQQQVERRLFFISVPGNAALRFRGKLAV